MGFFKDITRVLYFNITILDDLLCEPTEQFRISLSLADDLPVKITPNVSSITILDDECKLLLKHRRESVWKRLFEGSGREANTAQGEAECCIRPQDHSPSTNFPYRRTGRCFNWLIGQLQFEHG